MLTDNPVMLRKHVQLPVLMCLQKKADKKIITEKDLIEANIASFGDEIGKITNRITAMYEIQSRFDPESEEYKELQFRINCGQKIQQDAIDKTKGIVAHGMPRVWYDQHSVKKEPEAERREFLYRILATKKPRFMIYIYSDLMSTYRNYLSVTNMKCAMEFKLSTAELLAIPPDKLTPEQADFVYWYKEKMPVGTGPCVMNRICEKFEKAFDTYLKTTAKNLPFDHSILKSGAKFTARQSADMTKVFNTYNQKVRDFMAYAARERVDDDESFTQLQDMLYTFQRECDSIAPNGKVQAEIMLEICYKKKSKRQFVWHMRAHELIENLLDKSGRRIMYPVLDPDGDIEYGGSKFSLHVKVI